MRTVGELATDAVKSRAGDTARDLRASGISFDYRQGEYWMLVANRNAQLELLFAGSRWAGIWDQAMRRVPGATHGRTAVRFGAATSRYVAIPIGAIDGIDVPPVSDAAADREHRANWGD